MNITDTQKAKIIKGTKKPAKTTEQVSRTRFLQEVETIVNNDRASQYGGAEDSFLAIASLWNSYLGIKNVLAEDKVISCLDVVLMMDLLKTARICANPLHYDSWIDKAGYSACGGALVGKPMPEVSKTLPDDKTEQRLPTDSLTITAFTTNEGEVWTPLNHTLLLEEDNLSEWLRRNNYHAAQVKDIGTYDAVNGWRIDRFNNRT